MSLRNLFASLILLVVAVAPAVAGGVLYPDAGEPASSALASLPPLFSEQLAAFSAASDAMNGNINTLAASLADASSAGDSKASSTIPLSAPPAAILLMVQGLLFIGAIRKRRQWIMMAVAAISLGRAGIHALPRLLTSSSQPAPARTAQPYRTHAQDDGQRVASEAHTADLDYIWMLRRLGADPTISRTAIEQAISSTVVSGRTPLATVSFVPADLPSPAFIIPGPSQPAGFVARETQVCSLKKGFLVTRFARPPPEFS